MGAFLAALGAVLLFILRVIGILLLVVLILLVLLLLCPFCADLCWEHGVLTVKAGALGITFPVFQYPKPEPPPAPENPEPPRGFGKVKAKFAAWRAERKRKKAEEKARKKAAAAAAKANKPSQPRKKAKITLEILCTMLKGAGTLTKAVFGALRITKIQVRLGVRGEDPAAAARSYGKLQAWLYPVLGVLDRFLWLQFDAHPAGLWQRAAHRGGPGVLPGERAGTVHRPCGGAGAVRVLAQKSIGHLPIMWYTIRVSGSADNGPLPESNR